jgi:sugar lactone lactonase YvrE
MSRKPNPKYEVYKLPFLKQIQYHFTHLNNYQKIIYAASLFVFIVGGAGIGLYLAGVFPRPAVERSSRPTTVITIASTSVIGSNTAGFQDGPNPLFDRPSACVVDDQDNIYIVDTNNQAIRVIDKNKNVTTLFTSSDGDSSSLQMSKRSARAELVTPMGLAIDVKSRNLFIGDIGDHSIKIINIDSREIQVLAGNGYAGLQDGPLLESSFYLPLAAIFHSTGLYISDSGNNVIRAIYGNDSVIKLAGVDNSTRTTFYNPDGLAIDSTGNLLVADRSNGRIQSVNITSGLVSTFASGGNISSPTSIVVDSNGILYIAERNNGKIISIDGDQKETLLTSLSTDKSTSEASIGLAITSAGSLVVSNPASNSITILELVIEIIDESIIPKDTTV